MTERSQTGGVMAGFTARTAGVFWGLWACLAVLSDAGVLRAQPYLYDRGNGMVYNSWQDRTWLKDSMYIRTLGLDGDGLVTSAVADSFARNLVVAGLDDWRLPYDDTYSGGDLYMLYGTFNSQWDPPYSKGPFQNIDWKTDYWVQGVGRYDGVWFKYDFGSGPVPTGVHPAYAGEVHGVWPCRVGDVYGIDPNIDHQMDNGGFSSGFAGWSAGGLGTVDIVNYPGTANAVARMTTGSPVGLWQLLDTGSSPFALMFDFDMAQAEGAVSVTLGGVHLGDVSGNHGSLTPTRFEVSDPALLGMSGGALAFGMTGPSGLVGYIDNVRFGPVPEPATTAILAGGLMIAAGRALRRPVRRDESGRGADRVRSH